MIKNICLKIKLITFKRCEQSSYLGVFLLCRAHNRRTERIQTGENFIYLLHMRENARVLFQIGIKT